MRGFQALPCAQVVCAGHGLIRNLRGGFSGIVISGGEPHLPQASRVAKAWDELTRILTAA